MHWYWYADPYILLLIPVLILGIVAQSRVNAVYRKYANIPTRFGISSLDAANRLLTSQGIYDVQITSGGAPLSDHYDPRTKTIRLSADPQIAGSVAAVAVAAHECGHAMQHAQGYFPLKIRGALVPVVNFVSYLTMPLLLIGLFLGYSSIAYIAAIAYGAVVLFQLITLPVEFNASARAISALGETYTLSQEELSGAKKVLNAAAMTYVAATLAAAVQFLRLLALSRRRR